MSRLHQYALALGANLGDRAASLRSALRALAARGLRPVAVSRLYETAPAYVSDQPGFLNAAAVVETSLEPVEVLGALKELEAEAGRDFGAVRNGPRPLDLDIVFASQGRVDDGDRLQVPHLRWAERGFVMAPMADLVGGGGSGRAEAGGGSGGAGFSEANGARGGAGFSEANGARGGAGFSRAAGAHGSSGSAAERSASAAGGSAGSVPAASPVSVSPLPQALSPPLRASLEALAARWGRLGGEARVDHGGEGLCAVVPLPRPRWGERFEAEAGAAGGAGGGGGRPPLTSLWRTSGRPRVFAILNATPDSFSDGDARRSESETVSAIVERAARALRAGADGLDLGGQSTRPGASLVGAREEAARVAPVLRALREDPRTRDAVVTVDTFYASVAGLAAELGADGINDVFGGRLDPDLVPTVAASSMFYVLTHSRGDAQTMQTDGVRVAEQGDDLVDLVARELAETIERFAAFAAPTGQEPSRASSSPSSTPGGAKASRASSSPSSTPGGQRGRSSAPGLEPFRVLVDPGLGFAKTSAQSLQLLARLPDLRAALPPPFRTLPLYVGPSRKGFLGLATGRPVGDRDRATAAACALAVAGGANVLRVHDVAAVRDAVDVAWAARTAVESLRIDDKETVY